MVEAAGVEPASESTSPRAGYMRVRFLKFATGVEKRQKPPAASASSLVAAVRAPETTSLIG